MGIIFCLTSIKFNLSWYESSLQYTCLITSTLFDTKCMLIHMYIIHVWLTQMLNSLLSHKPHINPHQKVEKPSKQKTQRHESNRPPTTRQQHSHRGGGDDPYTTSSRGSGAPPRGGAMRSDRKELLRRPESGGGEHHARKYVGESRRGGGTRGPAECTFSCTLLTRNLFLEYVS